MVEDKKIKIEWKGKVPSPKMQKSLERQLSPIMSYAQTMFKITQPHVEMINRINAMMKPQIEMAQRMAEAIKPQMEMMKRVSESIKLLENSYLTSLNNWLPPLFDEKFLKELSEKAKKYNSKEFKEFSKKWDWVINGKPIKFADYFYALYEKHGAIKFKDKINRMFYFKKNTDLVLENIKIKFPERHHIIKEAFDLHLQKKYSCSINLMLPQVEGIIWDLGMKKGIIDKGYNSKILKENGRKANLPYISKKMFGNDGFHNIIAKEIFNEGFRNEVLHGRNIYLKKEKQICRWKSTLLILTLWRLFDES